MIFKRITSSPSPMRKYLFRLLFIGLSLVCSASHAADATHQLDKIARKSAQAEVKEMAQNKGWGKYDLQLETVLPTEATTLPVCKKNPVATPTARRTLYRLRYDVTCPDAQGWTQTVAVKTVVNLPVVIAMETLERGRVIDTKDVALKVQDIAPLNAQFFTTTDEAIGQTVKRRITSAQIVNSAQLEQPVIVERGQSVLMVARQNGIEASTSGEAMKQGRKGDVIRVKNTSSQRTVDAVVVSPGVVHILVATR